MSKEALRHIDDRVIFRETFNSEEDVRKKALVVNNVTFNNGIASYSDFDYIKMPPLASDTYSVRIIMRTTSSQTDYLADFRGEIDNGIGYIYALNGVTITTSGGNNYVNGVATTTINNNWEWNDIVITTMTLNSPTDFLIGIRNGLISTLFPAEYELFEIYKGTLTAEEVSLLYNNKLYRKPVFEQTQGLGSELIINPGFELNSNWTGYNLEGGETVEQSSEQVHSGDYSWKISVDNGNEGVVSDLLSVINGTRYKFSIWVYSENDTTTVKIETNNQTRLPISTDELSTTNGIWVNYIIYATSSETGDINFRVKAWNSPLLFYIDDISLKEITREALTPILNINPLKGVLEDKYGNSITNTDVTMFRQNGKYVGKYNGSARLNLNLGSFPTTSTILIWFNFAGTDSAQPPNIFSTDDLGVNDCIRAEVNSSDKLTGFIGSSSYSNFLQVTINRNQNYLLGITCNISSKILNAYLISKDGIINDLNNTIPYVPTTDWTDFSVGRGFSTIRYWKGKIGEVQIIQGILSATEIQNYYNSTKNNYR